MTRNFTFRFQASFKPCRYQGCTRGIGARQGEREDDND